MFSVELRAAIVGFAVDQKNLNITVAPSCYVLLVHYAIIAYPSKETIVEAFRRLQVCHVDFNMLQRPCFPPHHLSDLKITGSGIRTGTGPVFMFK